MDTIFRSVPGRVAAINERGAIAALIKFKGFPSIRTIITSFSHRIAANAKLMNTLQNVIYVYTTGDNAGPIEIGGMAFASVCNGSSDRHGVSDLYRFFEANKVSRRKKVFVTVGDKTRIGILIGLNITDVDARFGYVSFSMSIVDIPEKSDLKASRRQIPAIGRAGAETVEEAHEVEDFTQAHLDTMTEYTEPEDGAGRVSMDGLISIGSSLLSPFKTAAAAVSQIAESGHPAVRAASDVMTSIGEKAASISGKFVGRLLGW